MTQEIEGLMSEVTAEARRLRESGRLGGLEQELDALFESLAPHDAGGADFGAVLEELDRTSFIDAQAPVASDMPVGAAVKKTIRRLTGWQLDHLSRQISAFDHAVSAALRHVDKRLAALEGRTSVGAPSELTVDLPPAVVEHDWSGAVLGAVAGVRGRVLVTATDPTGHVERLRGEGVDAYGLDPSLSPTEGEVKGGDLLTHLQSVADGALGAAVVLGWADRLTVAGVRGLAERLAATLGPGGRLVVVAANPRTWVGRVAPLVADLSPGRPLHPDTWRVLLAPAGLRVTAVQWQPAGGQNEGDEFALTADGAG